MYRAFVLNSTKKPFPGILLVRHISREKLHYLILNSALLLPSDQFTHENQKEKVQVGYGLINKGTKSMLVISDYYLHH